MAVLLFGDPRRGHPVALFSRGAADFERLSYADTRQAGVVHVAIRRARNPAKVSAN